MTIRVQDLGKTAEDLITRPVGRRYYSAAMKKIDSAMKGEVVVLDFEGIRVMDPSFADEFMVKMMDASREKDFYVRLKNLSRSTEGNVRTVLDSYADYAGRDYVLPVEEALSDGTNYLGRMDGEAREVLDFIRVQKSVSRALVLEKYPGCDSLLARLETLRLIRADDHEARYYPVL
jgi:hypothetical protein